MEVIFFGEQFSHLELYCSWAAKTLKKLCDLRFATCILKMYVLFMYLKNFGGKGGHGSLVCKLPYCVQLPLLLAVCWVYAIHTGMNSMFIRSYF